MELRTALANIHRDPLWWRKMLVGGALMLSILGYPWVQGMVMESLDNTRKGYPSPLPPWHDWSTRYIMGLFALLIDFIFFVLPLFVTGLLCFCISMAALVSNRSEIITWLIRISTAALLLWELAMFASSVAPVGRLIYADEGSPEEAMSMRALKAALRPGARRAYARARLLSLPAYLPAVLLGFASWLVVQSPLPGAFLIALLLLWLASSALLYAHLVVAQIYAVAERKAGSDLYDEVKLSGQGYR